EEILKLQTLGTMTEWKILAQDRLYERGSFLSENVDPSTSGSLYGDDEDHVAVVYMEIFLENFWKNLENLHIATACCQNCAQGFGKDMSSLKVLLNE
nr:hypothetical protein [Tanacetum cinerariifolium]